MSEARAELHSGVKWSMEFDPSTGGFIPRIVLVGADGGSILESEALITVDYPHHEVHEGNTYQVTTYTGTLASNDSWGLLVSLTGSSKYAHTTWEAQCGGDAEIRFYQNVTGSNYGTKLTADNMNHASTNTPMVEVFRNPTLTVLGTANPNTLLPGGTGPQAGGGGFRQGTEHILAPGKRYFLQLFNRAGTSQPVSLGVQWYESDIG